MLYVLDALTGKLLTKISTKTGDTSNGGSNGLATVTPIDLDGDTVADYVYAGDMNGNMWKFDLSDDKPALWGVAYGTVTAPAPLYTAKSGTGTLQPITTPPEVAFHPLGGTMVLFGTGKYIEAVIDPVSTSQQTFYGIRDNGKALTLSDRSNLQKQTIDTTQNTTSIGVLNGGSKAGVDWASKSGWYIDLPETRERVVYEPKLYGKILYFPSLAPNPAVCSYGGDSWDYFVNYLTGGALDVSPFIAVTQVNLASGSKGVAVRRQSQVGMSPTGTLITKGDGQGLFFKTGSKDAPPEGFGTNFGSPVTRRVAWRELTAD
jgi:type IV pilus assembly protein PilY1